VQYTYTFVAPVAVVVVAIIAVVVDNQQFV
jgi:hypothetical protein